MADTAPLELQKRDITGKAVKQLRREGMVPAVIHDHGKASIIVSGKFLDVQKIYQLAGKHHPINLIADGKKYVALIKGADFDPRTSFITHVVFNAVNANQKVEAEIPIRMKYDEGNDSSPAERAGYIVLQQLETVEVAAFPRDLPEALYFDAEKLAEVGDQATITDLIVPKDVEVKADPTQAIATVFEPGALAAANDAAGGDITDADAGSVASDHQSSAVEGTQADEIRPGGKKEFEDKSQGTSPEKK